MTEEKKDALATVNGEVISSEKETLPVCTPEEQMGHEIARLVPSAGTIELTDEQKKILYSPISDEDIVIRTDGLIYAPWMEYATRLREAFGLNWAMVPDGKPKQGPNQNSILWGFYLVIQGKLVGYAIGEQAYHANNPEMTWGDACEGAKSNALMRLCKGIGVSLDLWKPSYIREWKKKHAESYQDVDKYGNKKTKWRKKVATTPLAPPRSPVLEAPIGTPAAKNGQSVIDVEPETMPEETDLFEQATHAEDAPEKQAIADAIEESLKADNVDYKAFKIWLLGYQKAKGKQYVGMKFKNPSLTEGKIEDLKELHSRIHDAVARYKKEMGR